MTTVIETTLDLITQHTMKYVAVWAGKREHKLLLHGITCNYTTGSPHLSQQAEEQIKPH